MTDSKLKNAMEESKDSVILQLFDITKLYPGTLALHNVSMEVRAGEVHGIIGKNGAGKTTLMGIISGIVNPTEGDIFIGSKHFKSLSRARAKKEGVSIVTQEPQLIPDFTVAENLFTPDFICTWGKRIHWREIYSRAEQIINRANLNMNVRARASDLTISEQQIVLVLKACYIENSQVIILDEVTASLSQKDQRFLYSIIRAQQGAGKAVLFISHRLAEILEVCDRVSVLRDGRLIATQERSALDEEKLSYYIIGKGYDEFRKFGYSEESVRKHAEEEVISIENLTRAGAFHDITFHLHKGEILGLAGLRGSGRTEILKTIAGIDHPDGGIIRVGKQEKRLASPSHALRNGIVYLPEDKDNEGLIEILSVTKNLTLSSLNSLMRGLLIDRKDEEKVADALIDTLSIQTPSTEQEVRYLSGGNKQKVVVGKILAANPRVFLLDEATKGIDIAAKRTILGIIREKLTESAGIILTSPGLEDLMLVCDRVLVLYEGAIIREFSKEEFAEGDIYLAMQGVRKRQSVLTS